MKNGFVALVGAGPGAIGLLTIRGKEYIEKADVVVFDRLVSSEIIALIPITAKKIDVGKQSSHHKVPQDQINEILLREALEGNLVVRLKGGDPFLFGRGGEELELLIQNTIPFEVVPGITSAIAVPSYAGIPVTHRDFCSSLHIITGHLKENEDLKINFDALRKTEGTLVFLMSVSSLRPIMEGLLKVQMDPKMPAAIIENGTRAHQRKVIGTIENLFEKATAEKIGSPAIIVVGKVCELEVQYDWFSKRLLHGKTIVVTRPKISGNTLGTKLKELGAQVVDYPCIEVKEILGNEKFEQAIRDIKDYQWLVFTSKSGVEIFFEYLRKQQLDFRILSQVKIAAIGSQTAKCLTDYGLIADYIPEVFDGKHLGEGLVKILNQDEKVLLLRATRGTEEILTVLQKNRIAYADIPIYETIYQNEGQEMVRELINQNKIDFITFTSASTVEGFIQSVPDVDLSKILGICIGNQTAIIAEKYGIHHKVAEAATIDKLIQQILEVQGARD